MHLSDADISIEEISKVEGAAGCDITIRKGKVTECKFGIVEMRRFFEEAVRGKPIAAVPAQVARVCGTCSNAHLLASVLSIENALGLTVTPQTMLLRKLLNWGLIIRDHALHLYVFALPDLFGKSSILDFSETDELEHRLVHDCFDVKEAGNILGTTVGGRSVHAPFVRLGGFTKIPSRDDLKNIIPKLEETRPKVLLLIKTFAQKDLSHNQTIAHMALDGYGFLDGTIKTDGGETVTPQSYRTRISPRDIPYSQATGYLLDGNPVMVGALSRINMNILSLHPRTRADSDSLIKRFPSSSIFDNNIAQGIEILHAIDESIDLIQSYVATDEPSIPVTPKEGVGYGIIEAPRGTLYHETEVSSDGTVKRGTIIVPTGLNQIGIEHAIRDWVQGHLDRSREQLAGDVERIIRAYDPCMSCATHFLKLKWHES